MDVAGLFGPVVRAVPGLRVVWPDDPIPVAVADPDRARAALAGALGAFAALRGGPARLVHAGPNSYHRQIDVRFILWRHGDGPSGEIEPSLRGPLAELRAALAPAEPYYWGGNNYFGFGLPTPVRLRDDFPNVSELPWDERYARLLAEQSWDGLRGRVFRFGGYAARFAERCRERGAGRVLVPSAGLCVHPWLFAARGLSALATDISPTALAALSRPGDWPRLYSADAFERWDADQESCYATQGNPERFDGMPDLADPAVRAALAGRVRFAEADWAAVPLPDGGADALFATNALPRDSDAERSAVLREWVRVVRPGGLALIVQHNFGADDVEDRLRAAGWAEADLLQGDWPPEPGQACFQMIRTSG